MAQGVKFNLTGSQTAALMPLSGKFDNTVVGMIVAEIKNGEMFAIFANEALARCLIAIAAGRPEPPDVTHCKTAVVAVKLRKTQLELLADSGICENIFANAIVVKVKNGYGCGHVKAYSLNAEVAEKMRSKIAEASIMS